MGSARASRIAGFGERPPFPPHPGTRISQRSGGPVSWCRCCAEVLAKGEQRHLLDGDRLVLNLGQARAAADRATCAGGAWSRPSTKGIEGWGYVEDLVTGFSSSPSLLISSFKTIQFCTSSSRAGGHGHSPHGLISPFEALVAALLPARPLETAPPRPSPPSRPLVAGPCLLDDPHRPDPPRPVPRTVEEVAGDSRRTRRWSRFECRASLG